MSDQKAKTRQELPRVLPRAFALLRLLATHRAGLNLSAISKELDVPKSSLSSTLRALSERGYLQLSGSLYQLGPETFSLASVVLEGQSLPQIAHPILEETTEESGETTLLATLDSDGRKITYIDIVESRNSIKYAVPIGTRRDLYSTAGGQLFLAHFPEEKLAHYFGEVELEAATGNTLTTPEAIKARFAEIRDRGCSITHGQYSQQASGFACPIWNAKGEMEAALVIGAPTARVEGNLDKYEDILKRAAARISNTMGYQPG